MNTTKGTPVTISPAYNSETGCRDIYDEHANCAGWVVRDDGGELLIELRDGQEVWLVRGRVK